MLLALKYTEWEEIAAAAWACDQQPWGDRYWRDVGGLTNDACRRGETAYVEITDNNLAHQLLRGEFANGQQAARAVDRYLGLSERAD